MYQTARKDLCKGSAQGRRYTRLDYLKLAARFKMLAGRYPKVGGGAWIQEDRDLAAANGFKLPDHSSYSRNFGTYHQAWLECETVIFKNPEPQIDDFGKAYTREAIQTALLALATHLGRPLSPADRGKSGEWTNEIYLTAIQAGIDLPSMTTCARRLGSYQNLYDQTQGVKRKRQTLTVSPETSPDRWHAESAPGKEQGRARLIESVQKDLTTGTQELRVLTLPAAQCYTELKLVTAGITARFDMVERDPTVYKDLKRTLKQHPLLKTQHVYRGTLKRFVKKDCGPYDLVMFDAMGPWCPDHAEVLEALARGKMREGGLIVYTYAPRGRGHDHLIRKAPYLPQQISERFGWALLWVHSYNDSPIQHPASDMMTLCFKRLHGSTALPKLPGRPHTCPSPHQRLTRDPIPEGYVPLREEFNKDTGIARAAVQALKRKYPQVHLRRHYLDGKYVDVVRVEHLPIIKAWVYCEPLPKLP